MLPLAYAKKFVGDESGAITVDFVVLTAALATFGLVIVVFITNGSTSMSEEIGSELNVLVQDVNGAYARAQANID